MYNHRVFKILDGENVIVFIPSIFEVYRIKKELANKIPDYISNNQPHPVSRWNSLPDYVFLGTNLILTDKCNLSCVYCYANAGPKKNMFMSKNVAFAVIDYIANCAQNTNHKLIYANMFGGEPTQAWETMISVVQYLRQKAAEINCRSRATITTNGCMTVEQARWLAKNMDGISMSFDGYKDIQDMHRNNSFNKAFEIGKIIYGLAPTKIAFRSTVSAYSVDYLPEIVRFFGENFPGSKQLYEPLFVIGRGKTSKYGMPSSELFFKKFLEALPVAEKFGCRLKTSVLNLGAKSHEFCGVASRNFMITPDGRCTTCNRMTDNTNKISHQFIYGHYDKAADEFVFNEKIYQQLKRLGTHSVSICKDCFAAASCRGDCSANKATINPENFWKEKSYRCEAIRQFIKNILNYVLDRESSLCKI